MDKVIYTTYTDEEFTEKIGGIFEKFLNEYQQPSNGTTVEQKPPPEKELLNIKETMEYLSCSRSTIRNLRLTDVLVPILVGKRKYFKREDILAVAKDLRGNL